MSNFKIDNNRLDQLINSGNSGKTCSSPSSRDVSEFEKNMQRKEQDNDKGQEQNQNPFESIFKNSFFSETSVQETQSVMQNTEIDFELTDKLVDRILVSDSKAGESEVRIQLGDDILKDTEISIKRLQDGSLEIKLNSNNYNSTQTLISQQFELKSRLEKMENCNVTVEVNAENQEQGNDAHQKSRGLFDLYNQEEN